MIESPALRIETARFHRPKNQADAAPRLDALLKALELAVLPGKQLSKDGLADVVVSAMAEQSTDAVCSCGHRWADHIGRSGCLECDGCRERRPHRPVSSVRQLLPTTAEVARAYEAEDRHFPQAGAR